MRRGTQDQNFIPDGPPLLWANPHTRDSYGSIQGSTHAGDMSLPQ